MKVVGKMAVGRLEVDTTGMGTTVEDMKDMGIEVEGSIR